MQQNVIKYIPRIEEDSLPSFEILVCLFPKAINFGEIGDSIVFILVVEMPIAILHTEK